MALLALAPFALALGMNLGVVLAPQFGLLAGCCIGAAVAAAALLCWFGPALATHRYGDPGKDEIISTKDRITGLLLGGWAATAAALACIAGMALLWFGMPQYAAQPVRRHPRIGRDPETSSHDCEQSPTS